MSPSGRSGRDCSLGKGRSASRCLPPEIGNVSATATPFFALRTERGGNSSRRHHKFIAGGGASPLVTRLRGFTAAKVDSIGLVVRSCLQWSAGKSTKVVVSADVRNLHRRVRVLHVPSGLDQWRVLQGHLVRPARIRRLPRAVALQVSVAGSFLNASIKIGEECQWDSSLDARRGARPRTTCAVVGGRTRAGTAARPAESGRQRSFGLRRARCQPRHRRADRSSGLPLEASAHDEPDRVRFLGPEGPPLDQVGSTTLDDISNGSAPSASATARAEDDGRRAAASTWKSAARRGMVIPL